MMIKLSPVSLYTDKYKVSETNKYMWINPDYITAMEPIDKRYRDYLSKSRNAPVDETLSGTMVMLDTNLTYGANVNSSMLFVQESVDQIIATLTKVGVMLL